MALQLRASDGSRWRKTFALHKNQADARKQLWKILPGWSGGGQEGLEQDPAPATHSNGGACMCPLSGLCSTEISEGLTALSGRQGPIRDAEPRSSYSLAGFASSLFGHFFRSTWLSLPLLNMMCLEAEPNQGSAEHGSHLLESTQPGTHMPAAHSAPCLLLSPRPAPLNASPSLIGHFGG